MWRLADGECAAQHLPGGVEVAGAHGGADAGAADCLSVERHGLQPVHVEAKRLAKRAEQPDVAVAPVAEGEVCPDTNAVDRSEAVGEFADEFRAGLAAKRGVELDEQCGVDAERLDGAEPLGAGLQQGRRAVGRDDAGRVAVERHGDGAALVPVAVLDGLPQNLLVAKVHAVEHADGEAGFAAAVGQIGGLVDDLHDSVAADSWSIGTTHLARSSGDRVVSSSSGVAALTLNLPETVRRRPARCAPQPSAWPRSCASVRT